MKRVGRNVGGAREIKVTMKRRATPDHNVGGGLKRRRGRNGFTKDECLRQEVTAARDRLFDVTMANIAKKKAKLEESKCYPCPFGNVGMCPHNEQGHCSHFNKKCDNRQV